MKNLHWKKLSSMGWKIIIKSKIVLLNHCFTYRIRFSVNIQRYLSRLLAFMKFFMVIFLVMISIREKAIPMKRAALIWAANIESSIYFQQNDFKPYVTFGVGMSATALNV